MNKKINFLTKLKMSLGIDTKADEIDIQLNDLRRERKNIVQKIDMTSVDLSKIDSIINDIDKIYIIAENDVLNYKADDLSSKVISYQLSIERAKRIKVDIHEIVEMQQRHQKLLQDCIKKYINNIINGVEYPNGSSIEMKILLSNISYNLTRLNLNSNISNYDDLERIKQCIINKRLPLNETKNNYIKEDRTLQKKIFSIENSEEKKLADHAAEIARNKKKR